MATIYRAIDEHMMERPVAVKVLREVYSSDPKFVTRFQREARAASALQHPNIVQVFDYGQSGDSYYIVMEYIDGMDLRRYLKRAGVLPIERGVRIARDVSLGLGAAHKRGIVHRDVKPQNIMLNEDGLVKLTDFGIASMYKDADAERLTTTGMTLGTVQYYAPEQAQGEIVRPSADIYALGIVMYEMLTGNTPFDGDTPVAVAMKHIQEAPQPPSELNPRIPPTLERIILRCLAKEQQARYRDGDELAAALDAFLRAPNSRGRAVPSGPYDAIGPKSYGSSSANIQRSSYGQQGPRSGYPGGPSGPGGGYGGMAQTGGPRGAFPQMSVSGRPGLPMGRPDDATVEDYEGFGPRGLNASVGVATPPPSGPTRPWATPDGTKPRWPGAPGSEPEPPRKSNAPLIVAIISVALVVLVAGGFLIFQFAPIWFANTPPTPTATIAPANVTVPDFTGKTCDDATQYVQQQKLNLTINCQTVTTGIPSNAAKNQIFQQDPAAGASVKAGSVVTVDVAGAPGSVTVPDVSNKNFSDACTALSNVGLNCINGAPEYNDKIAVGLTIRTTPAFGASVPTGSSVTVITSLGPQATPTPTVPVPTATPTTPAPSPTDTP
jgi:serine/threonine-protein kinase